MILCSSWHVYCEQDISGNMNEDYGYRPDKVEDRAKIYALSKVIQDCIVRFFDKKQNEKIFGVFRLGTILDYNMRDDTAAGKFITKALAGDEVTPYKHSMNRPMFFVSMNDVCKSFKSFIDYILMKDKKSVANVDHNFNLMYPTPLKIIDLANSIIDSVKKNSNGKILPKLSIVDLNGRIISILRNRKLNPGQYQSMWDGDNSYGNQVSSGINLVVLELNDVLIQTQKLILLK